MDIVNELCDTAPKSIDPNLLADWLEEQLGMEGPWNNDEDKVESLTTLFHYKLCQLPVDTNDVRLRLGSSDLSSWINNVHCYVIPLLMDEIDD